MGVTVVMAMWMAMGRRPLWHQEHLALGTAPRVVLPNLGMHGAVEEKRCACLHDRLLQMQLHGENSPRSRQMVRMDRTTVEMNET